MNVLDGFLMVTAESVHSGGRSPDTARRSRSSGCPSRGWAWGWVAVALEGVHARDLAIGPAAEDAVDPAQIH